MYNILLLEDDKIQLKTLSKILNNIDENYNIYEASDIAAALKIAQKENIHLFFIDIHLHNESGLKFASDIRRIEKYKLTWIIFVTIYEKYMLPAFKQIHCYDYILKPYDAKNIEKTTRLLLTDGRTQVAVTEINEKFIVVDVKNIQVKIFINDIVFVEVFLRTSIIHTIHDTYTINYLSLKKIYSMLNSLSIMQSHRSYLVNTKYISKIEKSSDKTAYIIHFNNISETALLGNNYKKDVLARFKEVIGGDINE
jgi:DNA-binding LytR/AlgR family response regulator